MLIYESYLALDIFNKRSAVSVLKMATDCIAYTCIHFMRPPGVSNYTFLQYILHSLLYTFTSSRKTDFGSSFRSICWFMSVRFPFKIVAKIQRLILLKLEIRFARSNMKKKMRESAQILYTQKTYVSITHNSMNVCGITFLKKKTFLLLYELSLCDIYGVKLLIIIN